MKRGSFDARVAKCIDQLREVEMRSHERRHRLGIESRTPGDAATEAPSRKG
ncbi:MAG TPA: hypothetical protein VK533_12415 [Sphingomonas sp.]|uniref:hypothetical protein n=1 Tax=Sphingomonas sp. TaxID=28214 RepID=UPI002CEEFBE7|nr:hypothetical protein [Sphingomonas sp.]HMI20341.1 hypothetical protein [Sphingomonas sp.]